MNGKLGRIVTTIAASAVPGGYGAGYVCLLSGSKDCYATLVLAVLLAVTDIAQCYNILYALLLDIWLVTASYLLITC